MPTRGGFAAWTERAKDVIVNELRSYLSLNFQNVLKEMPQIERYGLAGQTSAESFVNIFTALPHEEQRIPFVAIMSAPGTERKMGVGRQVIATYHDQNTGLPMIRETVGGDLNIIIEIVAVDTNQRSELTDIIFSFFTMYMEEKLFSFLGDGSLDENGRPQWHQLIIKSSATLNGETDQPRPEGEPFNRIYFNRITVPIIFIDYTDREAFDINVCYDNTLQPEDDFAYEGAPRPFPETNPVVFVTHDDFGEDNVDQKWIVFTNPFANVQRDSEDANLLLSSYEAGGVAGLILREEAIVSGRIRCKFKLTSASALVLFCMLQGPDPLNDPSYQLIVKSGPLSRLALVKGPISSTFTPLAEGSRITIPENTMLAVQLEWKIDVKLKRVRIRGYVAKCSSSNFGELQKRLEIIDSTGAFLTTAGEGLGLCPSPDAPLGVGAVVVDDVDTLAEVNVISESFPVRIGF